MRAEAHLLRDRERQLQAQCDSLRERTAAAERELMLLQGDARSRSRSRSVSVNRGRPGASVREESIKEEPEDEEEEIEAEAEQDSPPAQRQWRSNRRKTTLMCTTRQLRRRMQPARRHCRHITRAGHGRTREGYGRRAMGSRPLSGSDCGHCVPHPPRAYCRGTGAHQNRVARSTDGSDRWTAEPATTTEDGRMITVYPIGGRLF